MTSDQTFLKAVGRRVANARKKAGLTQEQLADKVDVHRTYIGFIEQGKRNPSIGNLHKISEALNTTLAIIFKDLK